MGDNLSSGTNPDSNGILTVAPARIRTTVSVPLQLSAGVFTPATVVTFHGLVDGREHLAVVYGNGLRQPKPLVRLHSECLTGDVFRSARCDCHAQLAESITMMAAEGGVLLYLRQEGRGIGLYNKIEAYRLQDSGMDTFEANRALNFADDPRDYTVAAQMLQSLGKTEIELISNNPKKIERLEECGITVYRQRLTSGHVTDANRAYLRAKVEHAGHTIRVE
nr:GTP cyclohydrolase II [Kibdelosporangium phytohabitans]